MPLNESLWQVVVVQVQPETHYCDWWKYCYITIFFANGLHHPFSYNAYILKRMSTLSAPGDVHAAIYNFSRLVFVDSLSIHI